MRGILIQCHNPIHPSTHPSIFCESFLEGHREGEALESDVGKCRARELWYPGSSNPLDGVPPPPSFDLCGSVCLRQFIQVFVYQLLNHLLPVSFSSTQMIVDVRFHDLNRCIVLVCDVNSNNQWCIVPMPF